MISYLEGKVKNRGMHAVSVVTNGVGYKVSVPSPLLQTISQNDTVSLHIHTHVSENAIELYGFSSLEDVSMFELLLAVSGIGPRTALALLSHAKRQMICDAILRGDVNFFTPVPRLGKKNAQKIIIELRPKLENNDVLDLSPEQNQTERDVIAALTSFGFTNAEAREALKAVADETVQGTAEHVRRALKYLGKVKK